MTITIEIPLPPEGCKPNTRRHWRPASKAIKSYRSDCHVLALACAKTLQFKTPVIVRHEWFMGKTLDRRYRPLDIQNAIASLKGAIDGVVDAGVIPDDSHKWLQWGNCKLHRSAKEHQGRACVVLTFEPLE